MITREDLIVLKEEILKTKKPKETYVQIDYGDRIEKVPVCIIINPNLWKPSKRHSSGTLWQLISYHNKGCSFGITVMPS